MSEIKIYPAQGTWVVRAQGAVIGESKSALELIKDDFPFVIYFPRSDIAMAFLEPSPKVETCETRGDANYFHITSPDVLLKNAAYSYEMPLEEFSKITGYIAFDAAKVTVERI
jgi:uncharacterized protein (DUF427 family)